MTLNHFLKISTCDVETSVCGCKVRFSYIFMALATIMMMLDSDGMIFHGMFATTIHEFGHICAMTLKGHRPREIECRAFDIKIVDAKRSKNSYGNDIFILLMGAGFNFLYSIVLFFMYKMFGLAVFLHPIYENIFLGVFNLLPIESLDGGQILYCILCRRFDVKAAIDITCIVSFVILFPIAVIGFYMLMLSKYNFSLLLISCYLIVTIVLKKCNFINY